MPSFPAILGAHFTDVFFYLAKKKNMFDNMSDKSIFRYHKSAYKNYQDYYRSIPPYILTLVYKIYHNYSLLDWYTKYREPSQRKWHLKPFTGTQWRLQKNEILSRRTKITKNSLINWWLDWYVTLPPSCMYGRENITACKFFQQLLSCQNYKEIIL